MIRFIHRQVSYRFVEDLLDRATAGSSIALVGPRFGGKRFIMRRMEAHLVARQAFPVVSFGLHRGAAPPTSLEIPHLTWSESGSPHADGTNLLDHIERLAILTKHRVMLVGANVDMLPHPVAREFLQRLRPLVEAGNVTAVLSGELDFRDLVHGTHSEFNCADQFVLQGFAEDVYADRFKEFANELPWKAREHACSEMWKLTGGNFHITRLFLAVIHEMIVRRELVGEIELIPSIVDRALRDNAVPTVYWAGLLRRIVDVISGEPECWGDLEELIAKGTAPARTLDGSPGALEISGAAIRSRNTIVFASPYMERLIKGHFTDRRMADMIAFSGQWLKAFSRYRRLDVLWRIRPTDTEDRVVVHGLLQSLGSAMFAVASGPNAVKSVLDLFAEGARLVLGFPEVSLWSFEKKEWRQQNLGTVVSDSDATRVRSELSARRGQGESLIQGEVGRFAVGLAIRSNRNDYNWCVIVSHLADRTVVSRERRTLAETLLRFFADALRHAKEADSNVKRLEARNRHIDILNTIFDCLGNPAIDVKQILRLTGTGLLGLGYKRVMFSLTNVHRTQIEGVLDCPERPTGNLAPLTDYLLNDPKRDLQPYVIWKKESYIVPDATAEPLVNKDAMREGSLQAFAVVVIIDRAGNAVGTIHIEREDGQVPTPLEVEDLELFGRQLARLMTHDGRLTLLQKSLDRIPEPLIITDYERRVSYANHPAALMFQLQPGWQQDLPPLFEGDSTLTRGMDEALGGRRFLHSISRLGTDEDYRGELLCESLRDWRKQVVGVFVHVQDLRFIHQIFGAIGAIGRADGMGAALDALMSAVSALGFTRIRLYVKDKSTQRLEGRKVLGETEETTAAFNSGRVILPLRAEPYQHSWRSLDESKPIVFHRPGEPTPSDTTIVTPHGLEAHCLANPHCPPEIPKPVGAYWVDVPLFLGNAEFGKITIDCTDKLKPEQLAMLAVLSDQARAMLQSCDDRERAADAREAAAREGVETSLSLCAHNLGSRLAALPVILARYRKRQIAVPELGPINDRFHYLVEHVTATIKRIRELLTKINPQYSTFDLLEEAQRILGSQMQDHQFELNGGPLKLEADRHVVESALVELLQNSRQFAIPNRELQVTLRWEERPNGLGLFYVDNGPGIPPEFKTRVFEPFFAHRPGMKGSSHGLGLSYVARAIYAHGGQIREEGIYGEGVCFVIDMPLRAPCEELR